MPENIQSEVSIIIVTYARDRDLRELLGYLKKADELCLTSPEVILIDNNEDAIDRSSFLEGFRSAIFNRSCRNLGCTAGRNAGIKRSHGKIVIFLDDDALPATPNFVDVVVQKFEAAPPLGILAFRIVDPSTGEVRRYEFPHTDKSKLHEDELRTFRFIGAGFAVRRVVFERAGLFSEYLSYGADEFEFAYRAIKADFEIVYTSDIRVAHKLSNAGRMGSISTWERLLRNKLVIGYLHLPFWNFVASSLAWIAAATIKTRGRANLPKVGLEFIRWARRNRSARSPLSGKARKYVAECGGQLWK